MPERKSAGSGTGTGRGAKPVGRPSSRGGKRPAGSGTPANAPSAKDTGTATSGTTTSGAPRVDGTKSSSAKNSATRPPASAKSGSAKTTTSTSAKGRPAGSAGRPPGRAPQGKGRKPAKGRSIVNQKQRPWGLIITTAVVVLFAAAVVIAVVATSKGGNDVAATTRGGQAVSASDPYRRAEDATAAKIKGITYRVEGEHTHVEGSIKYDRTPPIGGDHSQYWADCTGTVYPNAIANENAVHMLEHGAIWITYNKNKLTSAQVATLAKNVSGVDRMAMSPYPNLKTPISLQAWGYQLFVSSPTDPRIAQFIAALKYNKNTTPEYGATCSQPTFKADPSTFGHPLWTPKSGASGNVTGA